MRIEVRFKLFACIVLGLLVSTATSHGQPPKTASADKPKTSTRPEFPPISELTKGYTKVVHYEDGVAKRSLYTIWRRDKDGQMLAELHALMRRTSTTLP